MFKKSNYRVSRFKDALKSIMKEVNVKISEADFETLKKSNYQLCFAKSVNGKFNVIWRCYTDYLSNNYFSWTPQFQLFGATAFTNGSKIRTTTNVENCSIGMICKLNESGLLETEISGGQEGRLIINNQFGSIHSGVKQLSNGINNEMISSPIYVAENQELKGNIKLKPEDSVQIWFQQEVSNGMMTSELPSNSIVIDLSVEESKTCLYKNQNWKLV